MKMEMESQEGKTERLRAELGQEGRGAEEGGCHGGDFGFTGNGVAWHGDSNSPPHRRKLVYMVYIMYCSQDSIIGPTYVQVVYIQIKSFLDALDRVHIATAQFLVFLLLSSSLEIRLTQ